MVLLRDGNWTIEDEQKYYNTVIKHRCYAPSRSGPAKAIINAKHDSKCWQCYAKIPNGMIAIWKLQNWEDLVEERL